jgi:hypothetical protein
VATSKINIELKPYSRHYVVNQNYWGNDGVRGSLIDSVGVMVYNSAVYNYVNSYTTYDCKENRAEKNNYKYKTTLYLFADNSYLVKLIWRLCVSNKVDIAMST